VLLLIDGFFFNVC